MSNVLQQNPDGSWSEAIPEPYYLMFGRCQCNCGKKFWNRELYRKHYNKQHIDPSEDNQKEGVE